LVILLETDPEKRVSNEKLFTEHVAEMNNALQFSEKLVSDARDRELLDRDKRTAEAYDHFVEKFLAVACQGKREEAMQIRPAPPCSRRRIPRKSWSGWPRRCSRSSPSIASSQGSKKGRPRQGAGRLFLCSARGPISVGWHAVRFELRNLLSKRNRPGATCVGSGRFACT
jgi:hypothetical protein